MLLTSGLFFFLRAANVFDVCGRPKWKSKEPRSPNPHELARNYKHFVLVRVVSWIVFWNLILQASVMLIRPTIMKFGGTSVADAQAFERVAQLVSVELDSLPIVVTSAMSGVTDALVSCFEAAGQPDAVARELDRHFERHQQVADELISVAEARRFAETIDQARSKLTRLLDQVCSVPGSAILKDEVLSLGEQLASQLLTAVLHAHGLLVKHVDAREVIVTNEEHGQAGPLMPQTTVRAKANLQRLLEARQIPVVGGFIAAAENGNTTTLGRGGSDYSAAIIGAALNAREVQIWTDVSGVLTADPRVVPEATTVPVLSYQEAAELAYFGAKVLHPKTIQPAVERGIPVRVCNSREPDEAGTLIVGESDAAPQTIKAIAHKDGITTLQVTSARMLGAYGFLRALFEVFDRHRTVVDVVTTSEVSVSLSIDDAGALAELIPELEQLGVVEIEGPRTIVSVIGAGLRNTPGIAARVFSSISDINVSMISFGSSSVNLTFMVEAENARETITRLHRVCFENHHRARSGATEAKRAAV